MGKKIYFLILKGKKVPKVLKIKRKVQKKREKSVKKTLHLFPHILRFSVSQIKDFFLTVYGFMVFFGDPPLKMFF